MGLIIGLQRAKEMEIKNLYVEGDSLLVINQMKGNYSCNSNNLIELYEKAKNLKIYFEKILFNHIPRLENKKADLLSNKAVDDYLRNSTNKLPILHKY